MISSDTPSALAEDHDFRSRYIQKLVQEIPAERTAVHFRKITVPKVVVQYWHDRQDIPPDVQACLDSWHTLESLGFQRVLFDDEQAHAFISNNFDENHCQAFKRCYHPAMRCDYFRLCFILLNGGFYVDADDCFSGTAFDDYFYDDRLKLQPLCYDIGSGNMICPDSFLKNRQSSTNWIFYVNNNPIMAPPHHPIIDFALKRATRILLACRKKPEIQSTTGPGNITASLVKHAISCERSGRQRDFLILPDWETISTSKWPLSYRDDDRNWRLFNPATLG